MKYDIDVINTLRSEYQDKRAKLDDIKNKYPDATLMGEMSDIDQSLWQSNMEAANSVMTIALKLGIAAEYLTNKESG